MIPFVRTATGMSCLVKCRQYDVSSCHENYGELKKCVVSGDEDRFVDLFDVQSKVQNYVSKSEIAVGKVEVRDGAVYYNGQVVHSTITDRILELMRSGFPFEPMCRFLENLMQNPSFNSVKQLYLFLEHKNLPITEDGHFLAYKTVDSNYRDKHTNTFDNTPGNVLEVPRNQVDDDPNKHCSHGFHVGALEYSGPNGWYHSSGDKIVIVKVNPADAVSVPTDHSYTKLRVCRYEVLYDYSVPLEKVCYTSVGEEIDDYNYEDEDEDDDIFIDVEDVMVGDKISFIYNDLRRYAYVEEDGGAVLVCELSEEDPKFNDLGYEQQYRNFSKEKMVDIELI